MSFPTSAAASGTEVNAANATAQRDADAFATAAWHATQARSFRAQKAKLSRTDTSPCTRGHCESMARKHEQRVCEIALQSEITLAYRAQRQGGAA